MDKGLTHLINPLENGLSHGLKHGLKRSLKKGTAHNRYTLTVDGQSAATGCQSMRRTRC